MIKKIKTVHWMYRDWLAYGGSGYFKQPPLGKDHYYYVSKDNQIKSLINQPQDEMMKELGIWKAWELCEPREMFDTVEEAEVFLKEEFNDNEIEEIDCTDRVLDHDDIEREFVNAT